MCLSNTVFIRMQTASDDIFVYFFDRNIPPGKRIRETERKGRKIGLRKIVYIGACHRCPYV